MDKLENAENEYVELNKKKLVSAFMTIDMLYFNYRWIGFAFSSVESVKMTDIGFYSCYLSIEEMLHAIPV